MDIKVMEEVIAELEKAKAESVGALEAYSASDDNEAIARKEIELKADLELKLQEFEDNLAESRAKTVADMEFEVKVIDKLISRKGLELAQLKQEQAVEEVEPLQEVPMQETEPVANQF